MNVLVMQSCLTLCDPVDHRPPGFSVHGILQAKILEWVAISFSRGSSQPRDQTWVSCVAGRFFTTWDTREPWSLVEEWAGPWRELIARRQVGHSSGPVAARRRGWCKQQLFWKGHFCLREVCGPWGPERKAWWNLAQVGGGDANRGSGSDHGSRKCSTRAAAGPAAGGLSADLSWSLDLSHLPDYEFSS